MITNIDNEPADHLQADIVGCTVCWGRKTETLVEVKNFDWIEGDSVR